MKTKIRLVMTLLAVAGTLQAAVLSFEDGDSGVNVSDNMAITTQYLAGAGVTFSTGTYGDTNYGSFAGSAYIEQMGQQSGGGEGSGGIASGFGYTPDPNLPNLVDTVCPTAGLDGLTEQQRNTLMGDFFLRTTAYSRDSLSVVYETAVSAASFQIWDIDGINGSTEGWKVTAYNGDWFNSVFSTQTDSTLGMTNSLDDASYDGQVLTIALSGATFDRFVVEFIGTKTSGVGLAFNSFNTTAIPEPATASMMAFAGFVVLLVRRHFSK